jgi:hypothetical protein
MAPAAAADPVDPAGVGGRIRESEQAAASRAAQAKAAPRLGAEARPKRRLARKLCMAL